MWSTLFRPRKKVLQATSSSKKDDPLSSSHQMRKIRHNIERMLGMDFTEPDPKLAILDHQPRKPTVEGSVAASSFVDQWRAPRTLTTLSFIDGHVGRGYVTCRQGSISAKTREWANRELSKWLFVAEPQPTSHIWNEENLMPYLQFLAEELRCRRRQLGLSINDRAMIMMDCAGAHVSKTFKNIQDRWCAQHNVDTCTYELNAA